MRHSHCQEVLDTTENTESTENINNISIVGETFTLYLDKTEILLKVTLNIATKILTPLL